MSLQKRGLGRGLDALLGNISSKEPIGNESQGSESSKQLPSEKYLQQKLPIEFLQRGKYQPRKDMNPEKLQELSESIKTQGIIQPIVVRKIADEKYEIIAGERRWRAAQLANLQEVPVIAQDIDDRTAMAIALIENIQREDLNPLEEADALRRLIDEFGMTHQQTADAVGKSRVSVTNLLRLIELQPEVKKLLLSRQIEMGHARALLALEGLKQVSVANKIVKEGLSVREAERLVKSNPTEAKLTKPDPIESDTVLLQDELSSVLGSRVLISHKKNGAGKLVVNYSNLDELDGIIERIRMAKR